MDKVQLKQRPVFELWPISRLHGYAKNPRVHTPEDIDKTAAFIERFGFKGAIVARSDGEVIDGHLRLKALQKLGWEDVPVVLGDEWTPEEVKAFRLGINRSAEWAEWDQELLRLELADLDDAGFDLSVIDLELEPLPVAPIEGLTDADAVPDVQKQEVTRPGDVWLMGKHRLMCGDSTDAASVALLMAGEKADMVFTDPPYGVSYTEKNEFLNRCGKAMACPTPIENDEMPPDKMHDFWVKAFTNLHDFSKDRMSYFITAPQGVDLLLLLLQSLIDSGFMLKHQLIWNKNNHVLGRCDYNYKHEPIIYGWKTKGTHSFYGGGKFKTSVWDIPKPTQSKLHPTMKPVELIENAILDGSQKDQIVLDLFGGSGTTLMACTITSRAARLMELSPHYADVIVRRWQDFTGQEATLEATGRTFKETAADRGVEV